MPAIFRLGAMGFPRPAYGSFAGKDEAPIELVVADTHDGGEPERFPINKLLFEPEPDPVDETDENSQTVAVLTPTGQAVVDTVLTLSAGNAVLEAVPAVQAVRADPRNARARTDLARAVALGELVGLLSQEFSAAVAERERRAADDIEAMIALEMI